MQVTLTVTEGPHLGREFTFCEHDNFIVGRGQHAHFMLPFEDKFFSRLHFLVEVNPPCCRLVDMGSRNGTRVNGKKVTAADLKDGDVIRAGLTVIQVSVERSESDSVVAAPTPPPKPAAIQPQSELLASTKSYRTQPPSQSTGKCIACGNLLYTDATPASPKRLCGPCENFANNHPQSIDGYTLVGELGRGGMGVVYLAVREIDNSVTALKTIIPANVGSKRDIALFLREARILGDLDHRKIVRFREMGDCNGQLYFAMDYVKGTDAAKLLKEHGPLPIGRAVRLVSDLLEGLAHAHDKGFVHRDIKPANLLITEEDGREVAKLADFGLARQYQASRISGLTITGAVAGTVPFMAPEQITDYRGCKPSVDQYSAGATLYHLLTRRHPLDFEGSKKHHLVMILEDDPVAIQLRRKDIPAILADIIHRSLLKDPADRFTNAKAMRAALVPFCDAE